MEQGQLNWIAADTGEVTVGELGAAADEAET